ncbi:hypothetical protein L6452_05829 [Arctium lappa]|uniref:Uncharacterized protein n=1 Tax=Arctium lappa TaxID=4217 RepID=A0ACB9EHF7_ARCLA|nr:hypothetical protein L6452_05829 [Arctium lappa]
MCLKLTKDLNHLSLNTLYGILLNYKQSNQLKNNLVKDSKDSKSTPVALVSLEIIPSQRSTLTITELDSDSEDLSETDLSDWTFFQRMQVKESLQTFFVQKTSDDKYLTLKEKYHKFKGFKLKGNGLIAEEHDWAESQESSSDEEDGANLCLMDEIKEEVEEPSGTSTISITYQVSISTDPTLTEAERCHAVDILKINLYNALNGRTLAEKKI